MKLISLDVKLATKSSDRKAILLLAIPVALSAFTHLWNPAGFPYFVGDEGHYIRRALLVLEQQDPQEGARYDHPYFGQFFLAGVFKIIGYPYSLNPKPGDVHSTQMLYMVPRVLMGLLAVFDTFLIYKICERRYNNMTIAFIASILFAVMPLSWLTRRIYLDSIQLPFILSSILFAVYYNNKMKGWQDKENNNDNTPNNKKKILLIMLSGVFLGLAIFTKIPAITMIPLVGYLILSSSSGNNSTSDRREGTVRRRIITVRKTNLKALGLWFIPVILIPVIWPVYAISVGEFDNWYSGVFSQAERTGIGLLIINILYKIDPVLVTIGIAGFVYATLMKRDLLLLLWIIPFLIFHILVPWTQHFHWLQEFPAFCIASAVIIDGLANRLGRKKKEDYRTIEDYSPKEDNTFSIRNTIVRFTNFRQLYKDLKHSFIFSSKALVVVTVACIAIFGLVSTTMLIATNVNSSFFELVTFLSQYLPEYKDPNNKKIGRLCLWCSIPDTNLVDGTKNVSKNSKVTMIGTAWIFGTFWIPKYVYDKDNDFKGFFTKGSVKTKKVLIVADSDLLDAISVKNPQKHIRELKMLYNKTNTIATFNEKRPRFDANIYPYQSMSENRGIGKIDVRANY
jgi:hypothetical protein